MSQSVAKVTVLGNIFICEVVFIMRGGRNELFWRVYDFIIIFLKDNIVHAMEAHVKIKLAKKMRELLTVTWEVNSAIVHVENCQKAMIDEYCVIWKVCICVLFIHILGVATFV